jgi:hypothetical protein
MSTTSATTRSTATKASKAAKISQFDSYLDELDEEHLEYLVMGAIQKMTSSKKKGEIGSFLMKNIGDNTTVKGKSKRAPKTDEEGNVVKRPLSEGAKIWNAYAAHLEEQLATMNPTIKITRKMCLRLGSIMKNKGEAQEAEGDENTYYPEHNLSNHTLQDEFEEWNALEDSEKYPPKEKKGTSSTHTSDAEDASEKPKSKGRGRPSTRGILPKAEPKKVSAAETAPLTLAIDTDSEVEAEPPKARGRAKKAEEEKPVKAKKGKKAE